MPADYVIDRSARRVRSRGHGVVSDRDLLEHQTKLREDPAFRDDYDQLWDFRGLEGVEVSSDGIRQLARGNPFGKGSRRAAVVDSALAYGLSRTFQALTGDSPDQFSVFWDLASGERWLEAGRDLWTCPECGHRFVTKNMWHSCTNYPLDHHFRGCLPAVRATYERFLEIVERFGPVEVLPQKTRIAIQAEVRFAGCVVRKRWLLVNLWLTRRAEHPRLRKIEEYGPASFGHQFRVDGPDELDAELRGLIGEAYQVGLRRHL